MILSFSTQLNGKPTHFVSKIWVGIESKFSEFNYKGNRLFNFPKEYIQCGEKGLLTFQKPKPKLHTIREDKNDRWKPGTKIDFFINCRQKDMFRFAPVLPVVSTQKVEIIYFPLTTIPVRKVPVLKVDGEIIYDAAGINEKQMLEFANNDGFDTIENFFSYFNENFTGKLIHWTDKRY